MRDIEQLNRLFVDKESELIEAHQKEIEVKKEEVCLPISFK
jgi:hypothetical protein